MLPVRTIFLPVTCCYEPIVSYMAEPIWVKLSEIIQGIGENVLMKELFGKG